MSRLFKAPGMTETEENATWKMQRELGSKEKVCSDILHAGLPFFVEKYFNVRNVTNLPESDYHLEQQRKKNLTKWKQILFLNTRMMIGNAHPIGTGEN